MRDRPRSPLLTPVRVASVVGTLAWAVGTCALPSGLGTLVLAFGLLVGGGLYTLANRAAAVRYAAPIPGRLVLLSLVLMVLVGFGLSELGYGELGVPTAGMLLGGCLVSAAGRLGRRGCLGLGGALMVLGACGALEALRSAGGTYSTALVGLGTGALLWVAVAIEGGLHSQLRSRIGSR